MQEQKSFSIAGLIAEAAGVLAEAGVPEVRREAMSLVGYVIERDRTFLIAHPETLLSSSDVERLREVVRRRAAGEPLQYITGHQEFYGLDFEVTPDVLIPRPETELLVETALELLGEEEKPQIVCDVGTGSGCISIALLHERMRMQAVGLDISSSALSIAARNAERLNVRERLALVASDCFDALDEAGARFTMIVSNPPYVAEGSLAGLQREVRDHEPRVALTPGSDGLSVIRRLLSDSPCYLERGGHLLMEIGFDQNEAVRQLIDESVWQLLDVHKDLQGIPRTVALRKK
ncbi:MAG TPA: peptide chain release factor N(5)-glutamine methyltransferase [Pyrinomonadaceae bacterium]|nr:peptide chain release factor N(5)-glutamine methyltransferase [Pyrinomonadaceae bacterium]